MPLFPTLAWFEAVRREFNKNPRYRTAGGGSCDSVIGINVGERTYELEFQGFECSSTREISDDDLQDVDFILSMSPLQWRSMLENIKQQGHATGEFTLNSIDLNTPKGLISSIHVDQYREDLFFRYNQTYQYFFDASSQISTTFG